MNKFVLFTCLFFTFFTSYSQKVVVPDKIYFADQVLELTPAAQKKVQADVDALTRSESYFKRRIEIIDLYFPLIEQAFREEEVPDDIKYLVIQESALVGDAVSSANAIGYWQFKEASALEVGLSINSDVDERMNIVNASIGAARYLKSNNRYFDNWFYSVLAYNVGPGGGLKITDKSQYGKKEMKLDGKTHWYVLKFLAHKLAFENAVNQNPDGYDKQLIAYTEGGGKTLAEIAAEFNLTEPDLEPYNKWLKRKKIPIDKDYYVIIPASIKQETAPLANVSKKSDKTVVESEETSESRFLKISDFEVKESDQFPVIKEKENKYGKEFTVNGIPAMPAGPNETLRKLSDKTQLSAKKLIKYNDLDRKGAVVKEGNFYYLKKKKNKAKLHYHVVEPDETLWSISQRFGIKEKKLLRNNRLEKEQSLRPGLVLWMRFIRPKDHPIEYRELPARKEERPVATTQTEIPKSTTPSKAENTPKPVAEKKQITIKAEPKPEPKKVIDKPVQSAAKPEPVVEKSVPVQQEKTVKSITPNTENAPEIKEPKPEEKNVPATTIKSHIVKQGETLYSIARQYSMSVDELTEMNNLSKSDVLKIDQELKVSGQSLSYIVDNAPENTATEQTDKFVYHTVKSGDTLYGVARQYGVTIKDLMDWNDKETFELSIGEDLKIIKDN